MDKKLRLETTVGTTSIITSYSDDSFNFVGWETIKAVLDPGMPIQRLAEMERANDLADAVKHHLSMIQSETDKL
jgi:hypothetical protein